MMTKKRILNLLVIISGYLLILLFSTIIILRYFVYDGWNGAIKDLGNSHSKRYLMAIHFICGIFCMTIYPIQTIIPKKYNNLHASLGISLCISSMITGLAGLIYAIVNGTIGGMIMTTSFGIYGLLLIVFGIITPIIGWRYRKYSYIDPDLHYEKELTEVLNYETNKRNYKKYHILVNNLFGALIYSSLFYRLLYAFAFVFGYAIPINTMMYQRELDISFQIIYYPIPLILMSIYTYTKRRAFFKISLIVFNIATFIVMLL